VRSGWFPGDWAVYLIPLLPRSCPRKSRKLDATRRSAPWARSLCPSRQGLLHRGAKGQPHTAAVGLDVKANGLTLPPPEPRNARSRSVIGALGAADHNSLDASLLSTLEARPPTLRARCGRLVYQYESTAVNTNSGQWDINKHDLSRG